MRSNKSTRNANSHARRRLNNSKRLRQEKQLARSRYHWMCFNQQKFRNFLVSRESKVAFRFLNYRSGSFTAEWSHCAWDIFSFSARRSSADGFSISSSFVVAALYSLERAAVVDKSLAARTALEIHRPAASSCCVRRDFHVMSPTAMSHQSFSPHLDWDRHRSILCWMSNMRWLGPAWWEKTSTLCGNHLLAIRMKTNSKAKKSAQADGGCGCL